MIESPLERIPVVCEYLDVFLDEFPRIPPDRDIEFAVELQPGTAPISKRRYRMPPAELTELKKQLQELLDVTPHPIPGPVVLTPGSSLGSYILSTQTNTGLLCTLCPHSCAPEKTSSLVTHPKLL
jgi:hypothetical protein